MTEQENITVLGNIGISIGVEIPIPYFKLLIETSLSKLKTERQDHLGRKVLNHY